MPPPPTLGRAAMAFDGFPKQTLTFLRGLGKNNNKAWFDDHRADYDAYFIEPAKAFVAAMGDKLVSIAPHVSAEPKVNGSIFRINRDVRFSKDKTPYKDHLDLWFWEGPDRKQGSSGFYFRLRDKALMLGVGMHGFPKELLAKYRSAVADDATGKPLVAAQKKVEKAGYTLEGIGYKKVPRGFDPEHPRAELLKHGALHCGITLSPLPAEVHSKKLVTLCMGHWRKMAPVHRWLVELTGV